MPCERDDASLPTAQRYAPQLAYGRHQGPAAADARPAAVMLLLFPRDGQWRLPLTVRQACLADHAGQVSLPGGMLEPGESPEAGAMRELEEELGVRSSTDQLLGSLTPLYVFNSNFLVTPWLAHLPSAPIFRPSAAEVADLFELPLSRLLDTRHVTRVAVQHGAAPLLGPLHPLLAVSDLGRDEHDLGGIPGTPAERARSRAHLPWLADGARFITWLGFQRVLAGRRGQDEVRQPKGVAGSCGACDLALVPPVVQ